MRNRLRVLIVLTALLVFLVVAGCQPPPPTNVTVNFGQTTRTLDPKAISVDETGYEAPNVLANDPAEEQQVNRLKLGYMRMDLKWSTAGNYTSKIVCGGGGCDQGPTGDQWIATIKRVGAQPVVIVRTTSPADDAAMVRHFNTTNGAVDPSKANYVRYWIVGNEPDINGYSAASYSANFNADFDAMRAVDPNIKIGGPTTAWFDQPFIQTFLNTSGSRVDFMDFHGYPQKGDVPGNVPTLFNWAASTGGDVSTLRGMLQSTVPGRAANITIEVGEWDLNWGGSAQDNINFHAVWTADVLGHILANGGTAMFYGTKGNLLHSTAKSETDDTGTYNVNVDDPNPSYHGYGMFTGESLFPRFGNVVVQTGTSLPNVDVFASNNPKSVVLINKDQSNGRAATVGLGGVASGSVDIWTKNNTMRAIDPPAKLGTATINQGTVSLTLPPDSVTTLVVK